ncbi:MAG: OmpA family protein [Bacteroidota bacterium]
MKKLLLIAFAGFAVNLFAQTDTPFEKDYFKDRKDEYKKARDQFEEGMEFIKLAEEAQDPAFSTLDNYNADLAMYRKALPFLEKAQAFNPNYSVLNYQIGKCYLASVNKFKSVDYFLMAYKLNGNVAKDVQFYIGWGYHLKNDWDNAIKHYELYRKTVTADKNEELIMINKKIEECNVGKRLMAKPERVWVDNLGPNVNSEYPEYAPNITADESKVIFTGRRIDTQKGGVDPNDGFYFEDVYMAKRNEKGEWDKAVNLGSDINTESHDAPAGLSPDGTKLFLFYGWKGNGDIYMSELKNDVYQKPEKLNSTVSTKDEYESSATISFDGKELYFASERKGGNGLEDIYMCKWDDKKKEWGPAQNLGPVINTRYRETGVYLHPDGETMYFASQGHESMGGFDIFVSKRENGIWGKPKNLGYPINSTDDDVYFVVSGSGRYAYFTSFRKDGYGEKDIYRLTFLGPEKPPLTNTEDNLLASALEPVKAITIEPKVEVKTSNLAILKGMVRDARTLKPLEANIELIDNEKNELVTTIKSDATTGKYLVSIPSGKNYGIAVKSDGYLFHSENFDLPKSSGYREYEKNVDLKKVEVGEVIVLRNIFYDFDKATLRPESKSELERLIKLMNDNPTLKIEISSHTDSQGNNEYNQKLSQARAKSVVDYLINAGISASRLEFKGYGEEKLIVSDAEIAKLKTKTEKDEAHQQNRRSEFKILSK